MCQMNPTIPTERSDVKRKMERRERDQSMLSFMPILCDKKGKIKVYTC